MMLAAALMASFFFGKGSDIYKGGLRWGFLAIGAAAYVDIFEVWMAARRDSGRIPFGEQEGGLLSDATRLVDEHGWTADELCAALLRGGRGQPRRFPRGSGPGACGAREGGPRKCRLARRYPEIESGHALPRRQQSPP
jgi:hypothetical protein